MNALKELLIEEPNESDVIPSDVEMRLRNWVRYRYWSDQVGPSSTTSVLGRMYIAPKDPERRQIKPVPPDLLDGYAVDRCICSLPERHRDALMLKYLGWCWVSGRRVEVPLITERRRILCVSRATYYRLINRSAVMLKNLLTRETNRRKNRYKSASV
jgi:hypothetical protein